MHESPRACYCFTSDGYYAGADSDHGESLPHNATYTLPELVDGFIPHWDGGKWEQVENHKGRKGYVNGVYTEIKEYGPLPEGWTAEYVDPRSPAEIRRSEIKVRLEDIDRFVIRPMRAMLAGVSTEEDEVILAELEREAEDLRAELASLTDGE